MKLLGVLTMVFLLVFAFTSFQGVRADQADEDYKIGLKYHTGEGAKQDYQEAMEWFRKAADRGLANAQYSTGLMYFKGEGVDQNNTEAVKWFEKAANQGLADAQFAIGVMYHNGKGVPRDYAGAVKWFEKAANQGLANAQFSIGAMYDNGLGFDKDPVEAIIAFAKNNVLLNRRFFSRLVKEYALPKVCHFTRTCPMLRIARWQSWIPLRGPLSLSGVTFG